MTEDQRFAATRPDVLVYKSDVLDHDVTVLGPITIDLKSPPPARIPISTSRSSMSIPATRPITTPPRPPRRRPAHRPQ